MTARADEIEITSADVEAMVNPADTTGTEGLTMDAADWDLGEDLQQSEVGELPTSIAKSINVNYARLVKDSATLYEDAALTSPVASIADAPVMLLDRPNSQCYQVAFNTQEGIVTGYVAEADLKVMDQAETAEFLDALANADTVALYDDDLDQPLAMLSIAWVLIDEPKALLDEEDDKGNDDSPIEAEDLDSEPESVFYSDETDAETAYMFAAHEVGFMLSVREMRLLVSETFALRVTDLGGEAIEAQYLTFKSSNAKVASVDQSGVITALKGGTATITVTFDGRSLPCDITVPNEPTSIRLNYANGYVGLDESFSDLVVTMSPEGSDAIVKWSTSNANYVTVDSLTGKLTGVRLGSATITATTRNGKTASCKVNVKNAPSWIDIPDKQTIAVGQAPVTLSLAKTSGSSCSDILWTSSDESIARVEHGVVTGFSAGQVTITAETYNGKQDTCLITVLPAPEEIALSRTGVALDVNATLALNVTVTPSGAKADYTLTSSDPAVASVSADGRVIARKVGTTTITAETYNGRIAKCTVRVYPAVQSVALSQSTLALGMGMSYKLEATLTPQGANPTLTWSSSDTKVVTVADGQLTGVGTGSAVVTVRTANGKTATCKVTVSAAPESVTLSPASVKLSGDGMTFQLTGTVSGGSAGSITYTSSNPGVARVDQSGLITTGNAGTATITASTYNGKTATCKVSVAAKPARAAFASTELTITTNQTITPDVKVYASNGSETTSTLTFAVDASRSQNPDAVSIDARTGAITGKSVGSAVINVTTHNGVAAQAPLTVNVEVDPTSIRLDRTAVTAGVGEKIALVPTLLPEGCERILTWTSSKPDIATVDAEGNVTALSTGSATITVRTHNGKPATCAITVKRAPTSVSLSPATATLATGKTGQLDVTLSSGTGGSYTFSSSDPLIATVSGSGLVTGIKAGKATITVTTYNGLTASATVSVSGSSSAFPTVLVNYGVASYQTTYSSDMSNADKLEYMIFMAQGKLGKPYVWGSFGPNQFDCSGYAYWCFKQIGITLKQSAYSQGYDNSQTKIEDIRDLRRGDLVFFDTEEDSDLSDHSGIYLGNGYFLHASSSAKKVILSTLYGSGTYYNRTFSWGRRVLD